MSRLKRSSATGLVYTQTVKGYVDHNGNIFRGAQMSLKDVNHNDLLFYGFPALNGYVSKDFLDKSKENTTLDIWERVQNTDLGVKLSGKKIFVSALIEEHTAGVKLPIYCLHSLLNEGYPKPMGIQTIDDTDVEWKKKAISELNQNGQVSDMISFDELTKGRKGMQKGEITVIGAGTKGVGIELNLAKPDVGKSSEIHPDNFDSGKVFVSFEEDVIDWASKRNIIQGGTIEGQVGKLKEELQELIDALDANDQYEVVDAIGDITVVLTILAAMRGTTLSKCQFQAYNEIKDRKGRMINGAFVKEANLPENQ